MNIAAETLLLFTQVNCFNSSSEFLATVVMLADSLLGRVLEGGAEAFA